MGWVKGSDRNFTCGEWKVVTGNGNDDVDDDVYYYIRWRLKLVHRCPHGMKATTASFSRQITHSEALHLGKRISIYAGCTFVTTL